MSRTVDEMVELKKVFSCIDCGKCVSSCPIAKEGVPFSPRVIIEKALLGFSFLEERDLWLCLTCDSCTERCPSNVRFAEFVEAVRLVAIEKGITEYCVYCKRCGEYFMTTPILEHHKKLVEETKLDEESLMFCDRCKRYDVAGKSLLMKAIGI